MSLRADEVHRRLAIKDVKELEDLCFDYGLEYDGSELDADGSTLYRIEVPANRCDLLSVEGICRAFRVFRCAESVPRFRLHPGTPSESTALFVRASVASIRPFCFGAVLRNVTFTEANYKSFIDLQDKLHHNVARRRQLVAIGTHDLATLEGPFVYDATDPKEISFVPLNQTESVDGHGLMDLLSGHAQLKAYLPIIRDSPVYPVIRDARGVVLSVPPIINGDHSKITLNTKDVFIEVTATDATKGLIVLNALVSIFSEYCSERFTVEPVRVSYAADHPILGGKTFVNPIFEKVTHETTVDFISRVTGIPHLTSETVCSLLGRMMIDAQCGSGGPSGGSITATVPIIRSDVLHACDLAEDVAIAYGYNNIAATEFASVQELPHTALSNRLRTEIAQCGYHEALTWGLCSLKEGFDYFGVKWDMPQRPSIAFSGEYDPFGPPVRLSNPKTREFEMVRVSLLPGLLKTLAANSAQELPLRLFEIGDCVTIDHASETGAKTRRYCTALTANNSGSGLEAVHGLLDWVLGRLGLVAEYEEFKSVARNDQTTPTSEKRRIYSLVQHEGDDVDTTFLPKRSLKIVVQPENVCIGRMGVLHPAVLKGFGTTLSCAAFEISLSPFLQWLSPTELYEV